MGFTLYKAGQPLRGMELQEKEEKKDEKDIEKLIKENPKKKSIY